MKTSGVRLARRVIVTVVGVAVLALGVVLLAAPGPGFLVVALGFFILSLEYEWARRRFETARDKAADLANKAAASAVSTAFTIAFGLGMVVLGVIWGRSTTLIGHGWITGGSMIFGGVVILATIVVSLEQARRARARGRPIPAETRRH
jgi:uncharacterized protein (TIGR02611 family)